MFGCLIYIIAASIVNAADPCPAICAEIPGACGVDGSRCIDEVCTDLFVFWDKGPVLCNSSTPNCPDTDPLYCVVAQAVIAHEDHLDVTAYDPNGPDPCIQLCDAVPGACDGVDTACVAQTFCADLYWFIEGSVLCNTSQRDCQGTGMPFVSCKRAGRIAASHNEYGIVAYDPFLVTSASEKAEEEVRVVDDFAFAPGPEAALGRRGFTNTDGTRSNLASVLQVLLHSQALRRAILKAMGGSPDAAQNPVISSLISLLNQLYGPLEKKALDLTAFRSAIAEYSESHDSHPIHLIRSILEPIVQVSEIVGRAVTVMTWFDEFCLECSGMHDDTTIKRVVQVVSFPETTPPRGRWTIKEMLAPHFSDAPTFLDVACPLCNEGLRSQRRHPTPWYPEMFILGIDRYCDLAPYLPKIACPPCDEDLISRQQRQLRSCFPDLLIIGIDRPLQGSTERVKLELSMEIDFEGIVQAGEMHRYRLVGIVREIRTGKYVADYFDSDSGEWIHANDSQLHVIQGEPRKDGSDAVVLLYESI